MEFADYSPALSPSTEQQQDALRKGLGRTFQWAISGKLDDQPLLSACLRDLRHDRLFEELRGNWLWQLIASADLVARFREPLFDALSKLSSDDDVGQYCQIARHYVELGDVEFRSLLYEIVANKPDPECPWLGEEEIIDVDGEKAFLFAVRVRGERAITTEWEWHDSKFVEDAIQRFGEERVALLLQSADDDGARRYWDRWRQEKEQQANQTPSDSTPDRMRTSTVTDLLKAASADDRCFWFRGWGMYANEADLMEVFRHSCAAAPGIATKLLGVFSNRAMPDFDSRLSELCRATDADLRRSALTALSANAHPLVRSFAASELEKGVSDGSVVELFVTNYMQGDEKRILENLTLPPDENELHWLLRAVVMVLEKNPQAECFQLATTAYASTPCDNCRFYAARLLHDRQVAPEWLAEECRYDSNEDCRVLFGKPSETADPPNQ